VTDSYQDWLWFLRHCVIERQFGMCDLFGWGYSEIHRFCSAFNKRLEGGPLLLSAVLSSCRVMNRLQPEGVFTNVGVMFLKYCVRLLLLFMCDWYLLATQLWSLLLLDTQQKLIVIRCVDFVLCTNFEVKCF
jgi:hypothetical protein